MQKMNVLTALDSKRRGFAAIENGLKHGTVHIVKRNKPAAVVMSIAEYLRLSNRLSPTKIDPIAVTGLTAMQWLLSTAATSSNKRCKSTIEASIKDERSW